ncbi:MarR family transcriptional regulator [Nonomuraea sp. NPDC050536]|uniref:MarR family transcriptional regulator n=1 Tax=Nonomuraea sp. NPDC050536 TaxID=3364366 RepID=UPI0037CA0CBD
MRPIGYYLKQLDNLLEDSMERALDGVSRREWQALNTYATLSERTEQAMSPFDGVEEAVAKLRARGWLDGDTLTDAGRQAHTRIAERVAGIRKRTIDGISDEEYLATVGVLSRMCDNLG